MAEQPRSFRFSDELMQAIDALGGKLVRHVKLDRTEVLAYLVRMAAEEHGLHVPNGEVVRPAKRKRGR
jgi:hypothetical protein